MSTVAVNEITDEVGTGSPAFTNGLAQSDIAGALNATGTAPIYACRAWVNFDGTTATIRDSGNVSSITKNGTGDYTVNFTTAMPDVNYGAVASGTGGASSGTAVTFTAYSYSTTSADFQAVFAGASSAGRLDISFANISILR
jgi:hypothetical protein